MTVPMFGNLALGLSQSEQRMRQQRMQDEDRANAKREHAIQTAALLAGLTQQGISSDGTGDAQALGDTGYFRHPSMVAPDYQYMPTPEGVVKIDKRAGKGDVMRDASGNPVGAPTPKKSVMFDNNGKPTVVNSDNPELPSDFVGKHDTPKVKTAGVVNPATRQIEDVYDDGSRKVIRPATDAEVTKATHVPPEPQEHYSPVTVANPDGTVTVKPFNTKTGTTGESIGGPKPGATQNKANAQQEKEKTYVGLMAQSVPTMEQLSSKIRPERISFAVAHPMVGNIGLSQDEQLYLQAARNFLAGVLHQESGARLSDEQWQIGTQRFFPTIHDSPVTVQAKLQAAKRVLSDRQSQLANLSGGGTAPPGPAGPPAPTAGPFGDLLPKKPEDQLE